NILRDHIVYHARQLFGGEPGVTIFEKPNGLFCIEISGEPAGIDGSIAIRFKKLNSKHLASNVETKQALRFDEQLAVFQAPMQLSLFAEMIESRPREPLHLNAGYVPNELWTNFDGLFLTCPDGKHSISWMLNIESGASGAEVIQIPVETEISEPVRRRVRSK